MRKWLLMAVAAFVWKRIQRRIGVAPRRRPYH